MGLPQVVNLREVRYNQTRCAPVAQWTERLTSDQTVVSSNLAGGALRFFTPTVC